MDSFWGLALPLFFFCWMPGASESSSDPRTNQPSHSVTTNHIEVLAVTPEFETSSEGDFVIADLTETSSQTPLETQTLSTRTSAGNLILADTFSEAETREPMTPIPAMETRALTKIIPSKFKVGSPTSIATSVIRGMGKAMTTVETVMGSHLSEAVLDTLCTDDSSEEVKRITTDILTLAHTAADTEALPWKSSPSHDSTVTVSPTSQTLAPDTTKPVKALVAYAITDTEVINCTIVEIETTVVSDTDHSSEEGGMILSTSETIALPDSTETISHLTRTTTSAKYSSTVSATESTTSDPTIETPLSSTAERETTAAKFISPSGTLETGSKNLEETSGPSVETSHKVSISTEAGLTSPAESSATVYSLSKVATPSQNPTPSQTPATDSNTTGLYMSDRSPVTYIHLTTVNSSQETNSTLANTTDSGKTSTTAITVGGESPTVLPTTAQTRCTTDVTVGGYGGFFLLRLRVASLEDLSDPRVAEKLMQQLLRELYSHVPSMQVSLLRVRRD